ncbi:MAG: choice-of-anchor D domain-containing protein [Deltaproteobacteria bacterium]|nr:MAG: choice-of-anchor D domain-containing protein [Deltaproteobacteria bacterium]
MNKRKILLRCLSTWLFVMSITFSAKAFAINYTVNVLGDSVGTCDTSHVCTSLRAAITQSRESSEPVNTITLAADTYLVQNPTTNEDQNSNGDFDINQPGKTLTIIGAGWDRTIVSSTIHDRVFHVLAGTVIFRDLRIQNGWVGAPGGGGIYVAAGAHVEIHGVQIANNHTEQGCGGGIRNEGFLNASDLSMASNSATNTDPSHLSEVRALNVTEPSDKDISGGGLCNIFSAATSTLANVTINGNSTNRFGGGVYNHDHAILSIVNGTISGNGVSGIVVDPSHGGSIYSSPGAGQGGGIYNSSDASVTVLNSTIAFNTSNLSGAGIANGSNASSVDLRNPGIFKIQNSILSNNSVTYSSINENCGLSVGTTRIFTSLGNNISSDSSCVSVFDGSKNDRRDVDPLLLPLAQNGSSGIIYTHALAQGSPAFDLVSFDSSTLPSGQACPSTDARLFPRPQSDRCDAGAYEAGNIMSVSATSLSFGTNIPAGSTRSRRLTMTASGSQSVTIEGTSFSGITIEGIDSTQFTLVTPLSLCTSTLLASRTSCAFSINFTPTTSGSKSAQLVIRSTAMNSPIRVNLSGTAVVVTTPTVTLDDSITLSENSLSFSPRIGDVESRSFTITNTSPNPVSIDLSTPSFGGVDIGASGCFTTLTAGSYITDSCLTPPCAGFYAGGGSCDVTVHFSSSSTDPVSGDVTIGFLRTGFSHSTKTIAFSGTATAPHLVVENTRGTLLDFSETPIGSLGSRTFRIRNTGNSNLRLTSVSLSPGSDPAFSIESFCDTTLDYAPTQSCDVRVGFNPIAARSYTGSISIVSNDPSAPTSTIDLMGLGAPTLSFNLDVTSGDSGPEVSALIGGNVSVPFSIARSGISDSVAISLIGTEMTGSLTIPAMSTVVPLDITSRSLDIHIPSTFLPINYGITVRAQSGTYIVDRSLLVHVSTPPPPGSGGSSGSGGVSGVSGSGGDAGGSGSGASGGSLGTGGVGGAGGSAGDSVPPDIGPHADASSGGCSCHVTPEMY